MDQLYSSCAVSFLHRTVKDYIREADVQNLLKSRYQSTTDIKKLVCSALLAQLKLGPRSPRGWESPYGHLMSSLMVQFLDTTKYLEIQNATHIGEMINHLETALGTKVGPTFGEMCGQSSILYTSVGGLDLFVRFPWIMVCVYI